MNTSVKPSLAIVLTSNVVEVWLSVTEKSASKEPMTTSSFVTGSIAMSFPDWLLPVADSCRTQVAVAVVDESRLSYLMT